MSVLKITPLFLYGSEHPKIKRKVHLCTNDGKLLCGSNIRWGEVTAEITMLTGDIMWTKSFTSSRQSTNFSGPTDIWKFNKCNKCEAKYKSII